MKFIHVRLWDGDYLYPNGGYTYAYNIVGDKVQVAKAACSLKDNYCKRVGRAVAGGRLMSGQFEEIPKPEDMKDLVDYVLDKI